MYYLAAISSSITNGQKSLLQNILLNYSLYYIFSLLLPAMSMTDETKQSFIRLFISVKAKVPPWFKRYYGRRINND